jgi:hypothetical protein
MKIFKLSVHFTFVIAALLLNPRASAQTAPPQTYSFKASSNLMGPMKVTVNRNGPKELVELATSTGTMHLRALYDFPAQRIYTVDLDSKLCTSQEYTSPYAPGLYDPVSGPEDLIKQSVSLSTVRREPVNGMNARLVESDVPDYHGKARIRLDEKYGFPLKQTLVIGKEPERVLFEMQQISWMPSPQSLFTAPTDCTKVAGSTNANGGHAEMSAEVSATGEANLGSSTQAQKKVTTADPNRLLGKWNFIGKDCRGKEWSGTLNITKLDADTLKLGQYSNSCDLSVESGNAGRGVAGACLYDGKTKVLTFSSDFGPSQYSITAMLSADGKSLTQGKWIDDQGPGSWSASR